jgi:hypothetical protein
LAPRLAGDLDAGDAALALQAQAAGSTASQRLKDIVALIDDVNAARLALYGQLVTIAEANHLPPDWPKRFFRRAPKTAAPKKPPVAEKTP